MRSANGEISINKSVGIFSPDSVVRGMPVSASAPVPVFASFARSAWLVDAERATEKNRST